MTEAEFIAAYRQQAGRIQRYCLLRVGSRSQAEDLTAEVFTRLLAQRRPPEGEHLTRWLYTVARNLCTSAWRRTRETALPEAFDRPEPAEPDTGDADVWAAMRLLPEEQRLAIYLRAVEEFDFRTIARLLGRSVGAAKMLYYRGAKALAARLQEVSDDGSA